MTSRSALLAAALTAGCAHAPRSDVKLGYTDHRYFVIEHHDPAHGGRIVGTVCDVDLALDARKVRDGIVLVGGVTDRHNGEEAWYVTTAGALQPSPSRGLAFHVEAHDDAARGERHIFGGVGDQPTAGGDVRMQASHGVDLVLSRDRVAGSVAMRTFDLHARGDDYVGSMRLEDAHIPFVLRGAEQLWAMPAAAQASILPLLLTCTEPSKVIQMVDLRQSDTPPPSPPRWLSPTSSPAQATGAAPPATTGDVNRTPSPPPAAAQRARIAVARDDLR